jgi:murein DD-endopeptidase MepM/ murein hydrolase activator NlpD
MNRHMFSTTCRLGSLRIKATHVLVSGLVAGFVLTGVQPTRADQYTDQIAKDQQKQKQYDHDIAALKAQIAAAQDKEAQLQTIITARNADIADTQAKVAATQAEIVQIDANLAVKQAALAVAQATLAREKRQLAEELVIIYETENQSTPIANLVASGDFNSFWVQVIDDHRIGELEARTISRIQDEQNTIQGELAQIQAEQQQKNKTLSDLHSKQQQLSDEKQALQAAVDYLSVLQQQDQVRIAQINAANNALNAQIAQLQASEAAALAAGGGSGRFIWPDAGPITQGFGCTQWTFEPYDPGCPYPHRFHNGLDIAGPCGHEIDAADAGIAYIEPFQPWGFGNYVIIVHGNGWETLYGHMSGFAIHGGGQTVSRGQRIGYEGTTGNSSGCHLHFSVNHNNTWVNPLNFLS